MNESQLQKIYNYPIYPRDSKIISDRGFVNIDSGSRGGTHWTCFFITDNKSFFLIVLEELLINFYLNNYPNQ